MHPSLNIAKRAALNAGKVILRHLDRLDRVQVSRKGHADFVSEVDLQAEREIVNTLRRIYPEHSILAEESGKFSGDDDNQWLIDPLDGTTNYLHGFPHFAVSIAFQQRGKLEAGIVYDPLRQEMFTASRGRGALLNERRLRVRSLATLEGSMLATGLPEGIRQSPRTLAVIDDLMAQGSAMRRTGSAALDLAYVAAGRLDGFWESGLHAWDMAAGALLVQEAGGLVGDFQGGYDFLRTGQIVAANPKLFKVLQTTLHARSRDGER